MKNQNKSYIYGLVAVLLWSTVATAFKINLMYFDVLNMLFYSSFFSSLVLLVLIIFQRKLNLLFSVNNQDLSKSLLYGFLNPFLYYLVLFKAYSLLPAQIAQPLNYSWVIVVSILSIIFLKQKIGFKNFAGLIISFCGIILISNRYHSDTSNDVSIIGVFLAIVSSLIWGAYWIFNIKDNRDIIIKLFLNFMFGTIFACSLLFIFGNINFDFKGILSSVYIGMFEMGLTFFVWFKALSLSDNTAKIGNIIYLSPLLSFLFIDLVLQEKILITSIFGLLLIIAGVIVQQIKSKA